MSDRPPMSDMAAAQAELLAELEATRAALGDFVYVVTHDLRAPLRHIISYAKLLQEDCGERLDSEGREFLNTITDAAQFMGRQIDGLKEWAQLDTVSMQPVEVDFADLLAQLQSDLTAQHTMAQTASPNGQPRPARKVHWQIAPELPRLHGDVAMLRQLFTQLLDNALKFTRLRTAALIVVEAEPAPASQGSGKVTVSVRDNGAGFDPAQRDKLFNVFQRLHSASQFEGLGLGLALARKIALRHGGTISIDAAPNAGCHVSVTLPGAF